MGSRATVASGIRRLDIPTCRVRSPLRLYKALPTKVRAQGGRHRRAAWPSGAPVARVLRPRPGSPPTGRHGGWQVPHGTGRITPESPLKVSMAPRRSLGCNPTTKETTLTPPRRGARMLVLLLAIVTSMLVTVSGPAGAGSDNPAADEAQFVALVN